MPGTKTTGNCSRDETEQKSLREIPRKAESHLVMMEVKEHTGLSSQLFSRFSICFLDLLSPTLQSSFLMGVDCLSSQS